MKLLATSTKINAAGQPPKVIEEFVGNLNSQSDELSIARMKSPQGHCRYALKK